jgi:uncharacterized membrane protein
LEPPVQAVTKKDRNISFKKLQLIQRMTESYSEGEAMYLTKSRLEGLTDGIFAFAMTLLVIGLNLPDKATLVQSTEFATNFLFSLYSDFFHYVLAFLILGAFWLIHHVELHPVQRMNRMFVWLNLGTLLFVAMLPFSTSFSGDFPGVPLGAIVFELNLFAIGTGMFLQWRYATGKDRLVGTGMAHGFARQVGARIMVVPAVSLVGVLIALAGITWSTIVYLAIPFVQYIATRMAREAKPLP